jgi:hypothetical protein
MPTSAKTTGNGRTGQKQHAKSTAVRAAAAAALSPDAIMELIDKLGVKDLVVGHLRTRLENIDFDTLIDDGVDYIRRNPEVLVAVLGAVTVSAGLIVFLNARRIDESDIDDIELEMPVTPKPRRRSASQDH